MNYAGYRIKINGITIPNHLIARGTYSAKKSLRVSASYTDATGHDHVDYFKEPKLNISFAIRERNMREQEEIKDLFGLSGDIPVIYWSDCEMQYKESIFHISDIEVKHINAFKDDIQYEATTISLEER